MLQPLNLTSAAIISWPPKMSPISSKVTIKTDRSYNFPTSSSVTLIPSPVCSSHHHPTINHKFLSSSSKTTSMSSYSKSIQKFSKWAESWSRSQRQETNSQMEMPRSPPFTPTKSPTSPSSGTLSSSASSQVHRMSKHLRSWF